MSRLVRLQLGVWSKTANGEWDFSRDSTDLGYGAMVRQDETFESLIGIVKRRYLFEDRTPVLLTYQFPDWMLIPDGKKTAPVDVLSTADVALMMSVREWYPELTICVTGGSEAVATYQFQCRTTFTIGGTSYDLSAPRIPSLSTPFDDLVSGRIIEASQAAMEEIFSEEEMVIIHRVHLEMTQNTNVLPPPEGNRGSSQDAEIIEIGDEDQPEYTNQCNIEGNTGCAAVTDGHLGSELVDLNNPPSFEVRNAMGGINPTRETLDDAMGFGNVLLSEQFASDELENPSTLQTDMVIYNNPPAVVTEGEGYALQDDGSTTGSNANSPIGEILESEMAVDSLVIPLANVADGTPKPANKETISGSVPPPSDCVPSAVESENPPSLQLTLGPGTAINPYAAPTSTMAANNSSCESEEGEFLNNPTSLFVGMVFKNREAFKLHMALYAVDNKFRYNTPRSAPEGIVVQCAGLTCPWRVYAVRVDNSEIFEIRKITSVHRCNVDDRTGYDRQATTGIIGEVMRPRFSGQGGGPRPNDIIRMMQGDHDVTISYWKAWRSREMALDKAKGSSGQSYMNLPIYLNNLVLSNPGSLVELQTEQIPQGGARFKYLFFALDASIKGYKFMRKVIVVDGTHLKGKYAGCLLTASAQDGNYQIFPLGFAIVDGETDKAWEWFFRKLSEFIPNEEDLVFVSDRHASIYYGINKVYPNASHCACIVHLKRNIRTYFKKKHLGYLVARAARAYRMADFYSIFQEIKNTDHECADYLLSIGLEHWSRSHFRGIRYNIMSSNIAESWNAVLCEAREYPIIPLVEYIRTKLMNWFAARREVANCTSDANTPRVMEVLATNFEKCGGYNVQKMNKTEFEVRYKDGVSFHVDLSDKSCSCFEFQMVKIPCSHAIAAAIKGKVRVDSLVAKEYSMKTLEDAYDGQIYPVVEDGGVTELASAISGLNLYPPVTRRPPGRPRKKRFISRGEFTVKRTLRKRTVCSRCNGLGHNRATCKMPI